MNQGPRGNMHGPPDPLVGRVERVLAWERSKGGGGPSEYERFVVLKEAAERYLLLAARVRELEAEAQTFSIRRAQRDYLYDQWGIRIAHCAKRTAHEWHGWVAGNEDLRCPGTIAALTR